MASTEKIQDRVAAAVRRVVDELGIAREVGVGTYLAALLPPPAPKKDHLLG